MKNTITRTLLAATLAGLAVTAAAAPALADPVIVDEPDTSNLNNVWTFTPVLGVPVLGLVQSIVRAPNNILPV
ncbi:hypothetical protein SAMN05192558_10344 [Actinokineospora alba]|uniref:Secreted protein n=1 Tax=Actinokineospora alba TaxID=504798 RepID=A0A1H0JDW6_9PSEU|nr:hypothetical protein [Actinokineospora alba]TDP68333.1 hypothetical protein C8E96_3898 [Actinokineospora alba]SDH76916.1 hypothetical protein SAMN05421871_1029 [Actinokineospora alba]SDO41740.1 hypothetical protein SAMN05192558_10344 [Actinokineospora alba]